MKKNVLVLILACGWQTAVYAQETLRVDALKIGSSAAAVDRATSFITVGNDDYVKIGEWDADDVMSFHARVGYNFTGGRVGVKTMDPQADFDVMGSVAAKELMIDGPADVQNFSAKDAKISNTINVGTLFADDATIGKLRVNGAISATSATIGTISVTNNAAINGNATVNGKFSAKNDATITGKVDIGGTLDVNGTIRSTKVTITDEVGGADFVFNDDYALKPLSEVNHFIRENKHLPEIPSAAEMQSEGVNLGAMQMKLLQKVEELTLYMIQQQATIDALNAKIERLENEKK